MKRPKMAVNKLKRINLDKREGLDKAKKHYFNRFFATGGKQKNHSYISFLGMNLSFLEPVTPTDCLERGKYLSFLLKPKKDKQKDKRRFSYLEHNKITKFRGRGIEHLSIYSGTLTAPRGCGVVQDG